VVLIGFNFFLNLLEPYEDKKLNNLDVQSMGVATLTIILGIFIFDNYYNYYVFIGYISVGLINLIFFYIIIKEITKGYYVAFFDTV